MLRDEALSDAQSRDANQKMKEYAIRYAASMQQLMNTLDLLPTDYPLEEES